jgi:3-deoxy-D-manno-octulosonic-acid transferase
LKFDVRAASQAEATSLLKALGEGHRILVAGSTLEGEEVVLLEAWPRLLAAQPNFVMVLAPRHPERFAAVSALLQNSSLKWNKRSDWERNSTSAIAPLKPGQIVLLDTIGELASVYSIASVAFVGGSLVPSGGHNPLEPAQFGVPIVMGPHYANFRAITDDLRVHNAIRIASREELADSIVALLSDPSDAQAMGERARHVFDHQAGATARSIDALREILDPHAKVTQMQSGPGKAERAV